MDMTIIDKLQKTIDKVGCEFIYHAVGDMNTMLDDVQLKGKVVCIAFPINNSTILNEMGVIRERVDIALSFVTEGLENFNSVDNEHLIDMCKQKAFEWLLKVKTEPSIIVENIGQAQRVYDRFDCSVTGYMLNLSITETDGIAACDL